MDLVRARAISGFPENLPEEQIVEDSFKSIIANNYGKSGFVSIETPVVEREEILTSKGGDDNEIYGLHRLNGEKGDDSGLGLRFDLTIPLARFVSMHDNDLIYPFKRQQIQKVYRGERAQKGRYREFYQADVDIIGNGKLPLFADVEIISTINNALEELSVGDYVININNKKLLFGFLESLGIDEDLYNIIISIIDKKDKIDFNDKEYTKTKSSLFTEIQDSDKVVKIIDYIKLGDKEDVKEIFSFFGDYENKSLKEGLEDIKYVYNSLFLLGVDYSKMKINPSISRGLDYYTGTVFETFIKGYENMGSIASGGRYEDLASNFSKKHFPGVGGSIGLSRLIAILKELGKLKIGKKTTTDVLILNLQEDFLQQYLEIMNELRSNGVASELYLSSDTKISKQLKYAENKGIPLAIIAGEDEFNNGCVGLKDLIEREQNNVKISELTNWIKQKI